MTRIPIKKEDIEVDSHSQLKIHGTIEHQLQLKSQILQDQEKAKKWDNQKYIYEQNFEKNTLDLTQEEYEKYSSAFVIMTWIANELAEQNKQEHEIVNRLNETKNNLEQKIQETEENLKDVSEGFKEMEYRYIDKLKYFRGELQQIMDVK